MTRTLLIDADIVAYQSSASTEKKYDWGDTGGVVKSTDFEAAKKSAEDEIEHLIKTLKADEVIICLSDDVQNFRDEIYPLYKQNRAGTERPEHLYDLKEWLGEEYDTVIRPRLEADDVMGILSTEPHKGQRVIVSQDKDMQTIPGFLYNPNKDTKGKIRRITPEFAQRFMLWQALTGDQTDGYPGCRGCGPKIADAVLDQRHAYFTHEYPKGKSEVIFEEDEDDDLTLWQRVLTVYDKFGQTEADAIQQVNLARILKHSDVSGDRIIPWDPSQIF